MIQTREQLNEFLEYEKQIYVSNNVKDCFLNIIRDNKNYNIWKLIKTLRLMEFYFNNRKNNVLYMIKYQLNIRKYNKLQYKLGIELPMNVFDKGLTIYHTNGIVINGDAKVGKNCLLHGSNVIGNMGKDLSAPVIGDNVRLGAGAKVLGGITIADEVKIGSGAIVLHSCLEKGSLLVGIPAKCHSKE